MVGSCFNFIHLDLYWFIILLDIFSIIMVGSCFNFIFYFYEFHILFSIQLISINITPIACPHDYVYTSKGCCKFGNFITNAQLVFFFNNKKALHQPFPHWKLLPLEIMVWIGVATSKNKRINCFKYYASTTKILS